MSKNVEEEISEGEKYLDIYNFAPCVTRYALAVNYGLY